MENKMKKTILPVTFLCAAVVCAAEIPDMLAAYRADPAAVVAAASKATTAIFPDADRVVVAINLTPAQLDAKLAELLK